MMKDMRLLVPLFAGFALMAAAQERLRVEPKPPQPFTITEEGDTGRRAIAVPTATPPGRYTAAVGGESWTLDVAAPAPLAASIHPPVVLLNGYQLRTLTNACPVRSSTSSFGRLQALLEATGRSVLLFDNCRECPNGSIEDCALALKGFLEAQRTQAGEPVREFDLIGHSMGGLVARAYLAGKFPDGWFPPLPHRVRKLALIATPNFGAYTIVPIDTQTRQMLEGAQFQWDLGTWHQGADDLRGADAIAIAGAAHDRRGDGVISLMSASIAFAHERRRTRVLDYCHTSGFALLPFCGFNRTGIAEVDSSDHLTWRILESFLDDRQDWRFAGSDAAEEPWLRDHGVGFGHLHAADDRPLAQRPELTAPTPPASAMVFPFTGLNGQPAPLTIETGFAGGVFPLLLKYGPVVGRVTAARRGAGLEIESGQAVDILGHHLEGAEILANGERLEIVEASNDKLRVWLPEKFFGLVWLELRSPQGSHLVRIMARQPPVGVLRESGQ